MPTSQVSGQDSAPSEGENEDQVKAQQSSEGEAVEVQPEPVKAQQSNEGEAAEIQSELVKDEVPSEGETEAVQHESTEVRQEIGQEVETNWAPKGCTALLVPIPGKGAKGGKGRGKCNSR